jgi:hypothetical protein
MTNNELHIALSGEGYEEDVSLTASGNLLFKGNCDELITSVEGEIELCLNYGNSLQIFHHALRAFGNSVVLFPTVRERYLPHFFTSRLLGTQIFEVDDFIALWQRLRYDSSELLKLKPLTSEDWKLLWLLNIPEIPEDVATLSIDDLKAWTLKNIVSEIPEASPSVADIICQPRKTPKQLTAFDNEVEPVTVYIDCQHKNIIEWEALDSQKRDWLLMGNHWRIRIDQL